MTAVSAPMSQMSEEMCAAAHTAGSLGDGLDHGDEGDEDDDDGSEAHGGGSRARATAAGVLYSAGARMG